MIVWLKRAAIALLLLLALGASAIMCSRVAARGRFASSTSTFSAGPTGTQALFALLEAEGMHPARLTQDFGGLPQSGMLVAFAADDVVQLRTATPPERRVLRRFVERGGVVVVAGVRDYLPDASGVTFGGATGAGKPDSDPDPDPDPDSDSDPASDSEPAPLVPARSTSPLFDGLLDIAFRDPMPISVSESTDREVVLNGDAGPMGVVIRQGRGHVIVLASASPFQNRDLVVSDGAPLFLRLARQFAPRGPIYFDEYHLGIGERRSYVRYIADFGAAPIALQLLVIALFAFMRASSPMGPPLTRLPPRPQGTASYVAAIGTLYRSSADAAAATRVLVRDAVRRIAKHHAVAPPQSAGALVHELELAKKFHAANESRALLGLENFAAGTSLTHAAKQIDIAVQRATAENVQTKG